MPMNDSTPFLKPLSAMQPSVFSLSGAETVIGREANCDIALDSSVAAGVSRRHAAVRRVPGSNAFAIADLGSSNGTFVNGQRLQGEQQLRSGDRIQLGANGPQFEFVDPIATQHPATIVEPQPGLPQTVVGPGPVGGFAYPLQNSVPPVQSPYQPYPNNLHPTNNRGGIIKWVVGGVGLVLALIVVNTLSRALTSGTASAPQSSPASTQPAPDTPQSPQSSPDPQNPDPPTTSSVKVIDIKACKAAAGRCQTDSTVFDGGKTSIKFTMTFEQQAKAGTPYTVNVQSLVPDQGKYKVTTSEVAKKTFPKNIKYFSFTLDNSSGWEPGDYTFQMLIGDRDTGVTKVEKKFSIK